MASTILNRVSENLIAAGVSRAIFAVICNLKPPTLSAAYNGTVFLGGPREVELLTVSHRVLELSNALRPEFEVPKNAVHVKVLVDKLTDGTLRVEKIREAVSVVFVQ